MYMGLVEVDVLFLWFAYIFLDCCVECPIYQIDACSQWVRVRGLTCSIGLRSWNGGVLPFFDI